MPVQTLAATIKDPRLAVRDNVIEGLVEKGELAVLPIKNTLLRSENEEVRAAGVFALYRIGTANAIKEARLGPVSYTNLRAHENVIDLVCRLLLAKKKKTHAIIHYHIAQ